MIQPLIATLKRLMSKETDENPLDSLPNFGRFEYRLAVTQCAKEPIGWGKLKECERRLALYSWVESRNDPSKAQHRVFLDDCIGALLLSYESTLQYVKEAFDSSVAQGGFEGWLSDQPEYDIAVRGLRTLRNIEAHVRSVPTQSSIVAVIGGSLRDGRSAVAVSRTWRLPTLAEADLHALRTPRIQSSEIEEWNALVESKSSQELLTEGLEKLRALVVAAEGVLSAKRDSDG
jgi:hypothetical protein